MPNVDFRQEQYEDALALARTVGDVRKFERYTLEVEQARKPSMARPPPSGMTRQTSRRSCERCTGGGLRAFFDDLPATRRSRSARSTGPNASSGSNPSEVPTRRDSRR